MCGGEANLRIGAGLVGKESSVPAAETAAAKASDRAGYADSERLATTWYPPTFKSHSCTVPFRLTSNGCIESDPALGSFPRPEPVSPDRFRYSTNVYRLKPGAARIRSWKDDIVEWNEIGRKFQGRTAWLCEKAGTTGML
jgi:hypothetical protein